MQRLAAGLAVLVVSMSLVPAEGAILGFDDVTTDGYLLIPDGYGNLDWDEMAVLKTTGQGNGYENGTVSGEYVAFNNAAHVATVSDTAFDFLGAHLAAAYYDGLQVEVRGFLAGTEVYSVTVGVDTTGPVRYDFNFWNIDQLTFKSYKGAFPSQFAMDDFEYNEEPDPTQGAVPEPTTLVIWSLLGTIGLIYWRRRSV
ncbi:MAG TPA: hypothetical protein VE890_08390 [Thermoguttaceae bacterium]|nr:hypothetical protein [Thermoguttaceae bacterium]